MSANDWVMRPGVRAVVVDDVGRVLILRRPADSDFAPNVWNLPGGGQDPGEAPLEGAMRELREETGLAARATGASMPFTFPGGQGMAYLFREPVGIPDYPLREVSEARWVYPSELPRELLPGTREAIEGLAGSGDTPMRELDLTARRRWLEAQAGQAVAPWLRAMVLELAVAILGDRLPGEAFAKALSPSDPDYQRIQAIFRRNEQADRQRSKAIHKTLNTDGLGEKAFLKTLTRAVQLGRAEVAQAILIDAKQGKLPAGKSKFQAATTAALKVVARRHLRQVKETTEQRLAAIALLPDAASITTMLAKLYDVKRSDMIGQNLVAEGYVNGVADVLRQYGYNRVYIRPMADDRVCNTCKHFDTTPSLARMTIRQALKRLPIHPFCRCWIAPTPNQAPAPLNFKAPRTKLVKSLGTSLEVLQAYGAEVGATQMGAVTGGLLAVDFIKAFGPEEKAVIASQIAKKRNRIGGKFAPGKVTADEASPGKSKKAKPQAKAKAADLLAQANNKAKKQEAAAIQADAQSKPAPKASKAKPALETSSPGPMSGLTVDTTSPDHLIQAGAVILEHLRQATPGTESHAHLLTQYNAMRASIKAWNKSKGHSAVPAGPTVGGGSVKLGPAPAWVTGGADKLTTPKQFEVAALSASTKQEAIELAHYFEAYAHNQGFAGDKAWEAAWQDIRAGIKGLPQESSKPEAKAGEAPGAKDDPGEKTEASTEPAGENGPEASATSGEGAEPLGSATEEVEAPEASEPAAGDDTPEGGAPEPAETTEADGTLEGEAPASTEEALEAPEPAAETTEADEAPEGEAPEEGDAPADEAPGAQGVPEVPEKTLQRLVARSKNPSDLARRLLQLIQQSGAEVQQENLKPKE